MILSDKDIKKALKSGRIKMTPAPDLKSALSTGSLDMKLGNVFRVYNHTQKSSIDVSDPASFKDLTSEIVIEKNKGFIVHPHDFVLGVTKEAIELPNDLSVRIDGRSSLGRIGIIVHSTAGHVDAGFKGNLTLEITNIGVMPVILRPGMRICQIVFEMMSSAVETPYTKRLGSKYHSKSKAHESMLWKEAVKKRK
ncbi:MAG: dCTP deaminase [bacterium]